MLLTSTDIRGHRRYGLWCLPYAYDDDQLFLSVLLLQTNMAAHMEQSRQERDDDDIGSSVSQLAVEMAVFGGLYLKDNIHNSAAVVAFSVLVDSLVVPLLEYRAKSAASHALVTFRLL